MHMLHDDEKRRSEKSERAAGARARCGAGKRSAHGSALLSSGAAMNPVELIFTSYTRLRKRQETLQVQENQDRAD